MESVFVVDLLRFTEELGPTEFVPGSQKLLENGQVSVPPHTRERVNKKGLHGLV